MKNVNVKKFLVKHKWQILSAALLVIGTNAVTYHVVHKWDGILAFTDMLSVSYRDNQLMADYVDKITESWTPENKRALAERGAKILKQISDSVS